MLTESCVGPETCGGKNVKCLCTGTGMIADDFFINVLFTFPLYTSVSFLKIITHVLPNLYTNILAL